MALVSKDKVWLVLQVIPDKDDPNSVAFGDVRSVWSTAKAAEEEAHMISATEPHAVMEFLIQTVPNRLLVVN